MPLSGTFTSGKFGGRLTPLLSPAFAGLTGCYSMRLVVSTYTGAVIRLRRASDSALQDFYTNATQSYLTTLPNNTGTTFVTWLGASSAFVHTWYDQSGNARHATNTTAGATQPTLTLQSGKYVLGFNTANLTALTLATSVVPNTVVCQFYNTNTNDGTIISAFATDFGQRFGGGGAVTINGDNNIADWYRSSSGTKLAYNNGISSTTISINAWNVLSLSTSAPVATALTTIGKDGYANTDATRSITGYMRELLLHSKIMSATEMVSYYDTRML